MPSAVADTHCPKGPKVFAPNGRWAKTNLASKASKLRILAIGSSSTEGIGASQPTHSYPADLQTSLSARFPARSIRVVNAGVGGETAGRTVARLEAALARRGYDLVIWQVGTNDAVEDIDPNRFRAILERGISIARAAEVPLILVDPQYYPGISDPDTYTNFVGIVDDVGKERGVPVFSRYALMKAWAGESAGLLATMLSKDRFHMSDRGYACWASLLAGDIAVRLPPNGNSAAKSVMPVAAKGRTLTLPAP